MLGQGREAHQDDALTFGQGVLLDGLPAVLRRHDALPARPPHECARYGAVRARDSARRTPGRPVRQGRVRLANHSALGALVRGLFVRLHCGTRHEQPQRAVPAQQRVQERHVRACKHELSVPERTRTHAQAEREPSCRRRLEHERGALSEHAPTDEIIRLGVEPARVGDRLDRRRRAHRHNGDCILGRRHELRELLSPTSRNDIVSARDGDGSGDRNGEPREVHAVRERGAGASGIHALARTA